MRTKMKYETDIKWSKGCDMDNYRSYNTMDFWSKRNEPLEDGCRLGRVEYKKWEHRYTAFRIVRNDMFAEQKAFFNTLKDAQAWCESWIKEV